MRLGTGKVLRVPQAHAEGNTCSYIMKFTVECIAFVHSLLRVTQPEISFVREAMRGVHKGSEKDSGPEITGLC